MPPYNGIARNSKWIHKTVNPQVDFLFKSLPNINQVVLYIAQYYNDQAGDEVQAKLVISSGEVPDDFDPYTEGKRAAAYISIPRDKSKIDEKEADQFAKVGIGYMYMDVDYDMIESLQPYCKDGGDQNLDFKDNYTPFVKWTLKNGGILQEEIGPVLREWLVGAIRDEEDGW